MDDALDIVDEDDWPVGSASRGDAHRRGLLHRSVHVFLFNRQGELYLQRRSREKEAYPGVWTSSASGHVDAGESYEIAAARELDEEIGACADVREVLRFRYRDPLENEHYALFETHYDGALSPDAAEVIGGRFVAAKELEAWLAHAPQEFAPSFLKAYEAYAARTRR